MSDYGDNGHCYDCGGDADHHYDDCCYEGTGEIGGYSYRKRKSTNISVGKWWLLYIVALIIGYGINEILGAILMIGLIIYACSKQ